MGWSRGIAEPLRAALGIFVVSALAVPAFAQAPRERGAQPGRERPAPAQQAPAAAPPSVAWIDVHMHLIGRGPRGNDDYAGAASAALRDMDQFGIAFALILPPPQVDAQQAVYDHADYAGALARERGRLAFLAGGATLNAMLHRYADPAGVTDATKHDFEARAEKLVDAGAVGFGEIASLHISRAAGHPYEFVPADHPLLKLLADVAARRDVPIDLHMDATAEEIPAPPEVAEHGANQRRLPATMPALERLLAHNPRARIVWAHGGSDPLGAMTPAAIGRMMDAHPNLYVSLRIGPSGIPARNKVLTESGIDPAWAELLARHAERFVVGTDAFVPSPTVQSGGPGMSFAEKRLPGYRSTTRFLALLPPDLARRIGRDNAIRIYRLTVQ